MALGAQAKHKRGRSSARKGGVMPTWSVQVRVPVVVSVEVEADTQEEAEELALDEADFTAGETDGVYTVVDAEEVES